MSLEEEVKRDLERASRWERVHNGFIAVCGVLAALAWAAFEMYREWHIWH